MKKNRVLWIIALLVITGLVVNITMDEVEAWHPNWTSWQYFRIIEIDCSKVENVSKNFPILVVLSDAIGDKCQPDGGDLRFVNTDNGTGAEYHYEIEKWVDGEDRIVWVEIPTVDNDSNTKVVMYYGNNTVSDGWNIPHTWNSGYEGVWHMHNLSDSTSNDNDIVTNNGVDFVSGIQGAIGNCSYFNASEGDYLLLGEPGIDLLQQNKTLVVLVNSTNWTNDGSYNAIVTFREEMGFLIRCDDVGTWDNRFESQIQSTGENPSAKLDWNVTEGFWYAVTGVGIYIDAANHAAKLFVNGTWENTSLKSSSYENDKDVEDAFGIYETANKYGYNGYIDEIRLSNIMRNDSWINTTFFSLSDNLITLRSEHENTGGWTNSPPTNSNPAPSDNEMGVNKKPILSIDVADANIQGGGGNQTLNVSWQWYDSDHWYEFGTNASIASNSTQSYNLSNASSFFTTYHWKVETDDGTDTTINHYNFTTKSQVGTKWIVRNFGARVIVASQAPQVSAPLPTNWSLDVSMFPQLSITVNDNQGQMMNITWGTNTSDWIEQNLSIFNGTYVQDATFANESGQRYWWSVNVTDGAYWTNQTFWFELSEYTWGNWSEWWVMTYALATPPSNLVVHSNSSSMLYLTWDEALFANTVIYRKKGVYPSSPGDGSLVYNGTGDKHEDSGLDIGTQYFYRAWGWNETIGWLSFVSANGFTCPGNPSNIHNTSVNYNEISLAWDEGTNASRYVVRYNIGAYPASPNVGLSGYNGTNNYTTVGNLQDDTTYFFRVWSWVNPFSEGYSQISETTLEASGEGYPYPPYNGQSNYNTSTNRLTLSWSRGLYSDEEVVVKKSGSYPSSPFDGSQMQFNDSTSYNENNVFVGAYYTVWSFNDTNGTYSQTGLNIPWGALGINCVNESNPAQQIHYDIEITNQNATIVYAATDLYGVTYIDYNNIPYGDNTIFVVRNSSGLYYQRVYYYDLEINSFRNFTFYLPPKESTSSDPNPIPDEGELRQFTDAVTVTNPDINATIPLTYLIEDVIGVYVYNNVYQLRQYTDSASVTNPAVNKSIEFTHTVESIIGVYVYNASIYGGWVLIASDLYSVNDTHVEVDSDAFDDNSTAVRVDYYYQEAVSGDWTLVPNNKYTVSSTQVEIDETVLTALTTMARVDYYYIYYPGSILLTRLYVLFVQNVYSAGVDDAHVTIKRYIPTNNTYATVTRLLTDSNGMATTYLIPHTLYKVFIDEDSGEYEQEIAEWIPDPEFYGIYNPVYFRLDYASGAFVDVEFLMDNITWSIEPTWYYHNSSFTVYFNISSSDNLIEWFYLQVYFYNSTNMNWDLLYSYNQTNSSSGGSLSYEVSNVTGRYTIVCVFKKVGFDVYHFGAEDGCRVHFVYADVLDQLASIDDYVYFIITIILTALVMGFLVKFGAGSNAGIGGIVVMGVMFGLNADLQLNVGDDTNISVWVVFIVTTIAYILAMFILGRGSSR